MNKFERRLKGKFKFLKRIRNAGYTPKVIQDVVNRTGSCNLNSYFTWTTHSTTTWFSSRRKEQIQT